MDSNGREWGGALPQTRSGRIKSCLSVLFCSAMCLHTSPICVYSHPFAADSLPLLSVRPLCSPCLRGEDSEAGFVPLYNGRDLSGWHVQGGRLEAWKADGERLSCVRPGGGYLTSDREYGDFELRLEYRIGPGGNTGVGIRYPRGGHPSVDGMEIQILDDDAPQYGKLSILQRNGAIYAHVAPAAKAARPVGAWNELAIRCRGPHVTIHLNGVQIQNANLDEYPESLGKGKVPLARRPRKGCVGLQSHGDPVDFRRLRIRELESE